MKRISVCLFVCLSVALSALASESWLLDVPVRGIPNQETGKVRLVMGLDAAPAGSQLVVNGTTTLNLNTSAMVNGDSFAFNAGNGNEIEIIYQPLSNFGADFCAGGGAIEKQIPLRFVGAQDILDYRITSYIVAAPMAECSQVSKHTGDTPANVQIVGDGVAPALVATFKGRNTFDVVLVLDKSGSMADNPPGANAPPVKADILKSAVQGFVSQWELLDAPPGGGPEWSHDRLGVVFFDSTAASQTLPGADPPANFFLQRGGANAWDAVINKTNTLTPGSSTSIGAGINEGMSQWKADPKSDLSLVVVTDGMQNTAPLITPTGSGFLGLTPVAGLDQELRKRFIPIQTIAFGTPAQVDQTLLTNIAFETSGVSYVAVNSTTMFDVFGMTLVALLKGNTASIATRQADTITGTGPTAPHPVLVDSSAQRVVFSLQWAPPLRNVLDLEVFKPGSIVVAAPTASKHEPQIALQAFDHPVPGVWNVRVKRTPDQHLVPIAYTLNVFFLEKHLDYQFSLDNLHAVTGDPLGIRVLVAWDGRPLTGLPNGSIRVRVQRQLAGLGTVLHDTDRRVPTGTTVTPAGDIQTPLDAKLASFKGQSLLSQIALQDVVTIPLTEVGNGVYAATFDQSTVPGTYGFEALLDWDTRLTGRIHREERLEETLGVKADPVKTTVTTTQLQPGLWTVTVTPADRFGNFFGPGYARVIHARLRTEGGSISEVPVDARQTGDYVFTVKSAFPPEVIVTVDGVIIGGPRGT
ncbi:MAG TPA: vWA domain-containing protein [Thermoanaerobaculia bacterium]|nr:vWA domain-containing protein [Thermoanaerobaculia bacterium]